MGCDFRIEEELRAGGATLVAGVDEAGRGPLAGPVVAGAVILARDSSFEGLDDSKKLSAARREALFEALQTGEGVLWSVGEASVEEIEKLNILRATHLAMERAVRGLGEEPDTCIIDGLAVPGFPFPQKAVVKGDAQSLSVAAASIVAKVTRDRLMTEYDGLYPQYGFKKHKGYGTRAHLENLRLYGPCPIHRKTFRPVAQLASAVGEEGA